MSCRLKVVSFEGHVVPQCAANYSCIKNLALAVYYVYTERCIHCLYTTLYTCCLRTVAVGRAINQCGSIVDDGRATTEQHGGSTDRFSINTAAINALIEVELGELRELGGNK